MINTLRANKDVKKKSNDDLEEIHNQSEYWDLFDPAWDTKGRIGTWQVEAEGDQFQEFTDK